MFDKLLDIFLKSVLTIVELTRIPRRAKNKTPVVYIFAELWFLHCTIRGSNDNDASIEASLDFILNNGVA